MKATAQPSVATQNDPFETAAVLATVARVHIVGIGGSGNSALARLMRAHGLHVTGSDSRASAATASLDRHGITVTIGHRAETLDFTEGVVVVSAAIPFDNPEVRAAHERGIPVVKYAVALAALIATRRVVAIAGTHGKTTTSALMAYLLRHTGIDAGFVVGGTVPQLEGSAAEGRAREFVVEACEYDCSFLHFTPTWAAITTVDADHLDCFGTLEGVEEAFTAFARRIRPEGLLVTTAEVWSRLAKRLERDPDWERQRVRVRTVGTAPLDAVRIEPIAVPLSGPVEDGALRGRRPVASAFRLVSGHESLGTFELRIHGAHNQWNAAMAILLALEAGADLDRIRAEISGFLGVDRRMTVHLRTPELIVVDDYGHHPVELRATLAAVRSNAFAESLLPRRLVLVFQPHQYSRTRQQFDAFVDALALADRVVLPEIYPARDSAEDRAAVSSRDLVAALAARGVDAVFCPTLDDAAEAAWSGRRPGDIVLTSGAGDVDRVAEELVRRASKG